MTSSTADAPDRGYGEDGDEKGDAGDAASSLFAAPPPAPRWVGGTQSVPRSEEPLHPAASAAGLRTRLLGQPMPGGLVPEVFQQVCGSLFFFGLTDPRRIAIVVT